MKIGDAVAGLAVGVAASYIYGKLNPQASPTINLNLNAPGVTVPDLSKIANTVSQAYSNVGKLLDTPIASTGMTPADYFTQGLTSTIPGSSTIIYGMGLLPHPEGLIEALQQPNYWNQASYGSWAVDAIANNYSPVTQTTYDFMKSLGLTVNV